MKTNRTPPLPDVLTIEYLDALIAELKDRGLAAHFRGFPTFDPEALPAGWRLLQAGEIHPNVVFAQDRRTGRGEWLVFEPAAGQ